MLNIRNFAIIAHVDHGKSTLADRLLEITGVVKAGAHEEQLLDRNPISRERGITIKLAPVRMQYKILNSELFILNLIDTPGHVDFSYEVDRTLACVEGVILLVDATQGVQAQTIANAYKAIEKNLVIIPVVNKIDLPSADIEQTKNQIKDFLGVNPVRNSRVGIISNGVKEEEILEVSAKTGEGVIQLLQAIIKKVPPPITNNPSPITRSLIFDSYYDSHRGVIAFIRAFQGKIQKKDKVKLVAGGLSFEIQEVGYFTPELTPTDQLNEGEIGYIVTNLKDIHQVRVGDTVVSEKSQEPLLTGYKQIKSIVFASVFTTETKDYLNLKKALEKLYLNDSSLTFSPIYSKALGAGFRVGFLGLLHADVVRERLEREFNLSLVLTPPQVEFKKENNIFFEPYVKVFIVTPQEYLGQVMRLCESYRAKFITMDNKSKITLSYEMPMSEMIADFHDNLKSMTSGYASFDWEFLRYQEVKADQLMILLNNDEVAEFSEIVVSERAIERGRILCHRLRDIIPKQQFDVKIQAKYKGKIIASERISPFRKNVLMKHSKLVGGGDFSRKRKLLEKQKEGKKKMKMVGRVEIPKEAFMKLFRK